ncbi:hypothetical protein CF326_g2105 [Tilletia indica]|nr:hypothetical protein CF326_g2105 [Tilletia indica]
MTNDASKPNKIQIISSESPDCHHQDSGKVDSPTNDLLPQETEPHPSDQNTASLLAPPPSAKRSSRKKTPLLERRRGPSNLVVNTVVPRSANLPVVIQTADTLNRLRKAGWDDLKTPKALPSVPVSAGWDSDESQKGSATWIRSAFAADAFRPVPDMISSDYQNFPVLMDLQCCSPSSDKAPLFLVHPDAGFGVAYLGLPNVDRAVYALSNTYLPNGLAFKSINSAAQIYLKHIRAVRKEGPYLFGGWGFGGNVAREMAAILTQEWAELEAMESEETKKAHREKRRVFVMMIDSFNESWAPFQDPVPPNQTIVAPPPMASGLPLVARSPRPRPHRKVLAFRAASPCCSPSKLSFTDRCIITNAALRNFADDTVQHLRDQYRLSASLLKDEDPTAFARRPSTFLGREALKQASLLGMGTFAHVFLLKAGRLGTIAHAVPYEERVLLTRRFLSKVNGWAGPELAPGLSHWNGSENALGENIAQVLTRVQTIPFTHNEMFSPAGCEQVGQWLRACLSAINA